MEPNLKEGSFFISSSIPFKFISPKEGDVILFRNNNKNIVKRISKIENNKYFVSGDNKKDSMKFDSLTSEKILGKVIWIL